jgi:hypothetical protein
MKRRLALLVLAALPPVVAASPMQGWQILRAAKLAAGGSAWDSVHSLELSGTLALGGMSGRLTSYQDLTNAKFRNDFALGPVTQSTGFDGRMGWTRDSNGDVAPHDSPAERRADRTQAYLGARDYWFPRRWPATIARASVVAHGSSRYEVLRMVPKGGVPFEIWIDLATQRITRIIVPGQFGDEITSYANYRDVDGLILPFSMSVAAGGAGNEQTISVSRVVVNGPIGARVYGAPRQHLADYSFASTRRRATIPFRLIGDHIYFPVEIQGHIFQFGLDTGGINIISAKVAATIGARTEGTASATGVGAKHIAVSFARVPAVSLDSKLTIRHQVFIVVPLSKISAVEGTALDGVLGYELFKRFVVRIDYANHLLQILPAADFDPASAGTTVPFTYDGRMPQIAGSLDGLTGRFDIDTGSRDVLSINAPFVKADRLLDHYDHTARTVTGWGAGGATYGVIARAREFRVGDVAIPCPLLALSTQTEGTDAERSVAGVIGNAMLSRFTVTFDYARQFVYLHRNRLFGKPFSYDRSGMWVNQARRSFVVEYVMAGSPAQRAGVHAGDLIASVDGKHTASMNLADFRRMLRILPSGTRLNLEVIRASTTLPISLVLRELIPACGKGTG